MALARSLRPSVFSRFSRRRDGSRGIADASCAIVAASACLLAMVGCGWTSGPQGRRELARNRMVIRVCVGKSSHLGQRDMLAAMKAEAAERKLDLAVSGSGGATLLPRTAAKTSRANHPAAIVLGCCDMKTAQESILSAGEAGVPVFAAETPGVEAGGVVASSVCSDYRTGGRDAARAVVDMLDGDGDVAILDHPQSPAAVTVTTAFREQIALMPRMRIVAIAPGGGEEETAFCAAREILREHPDLGGLFAVDGPSGFGTLRAVSGAGRTGQVKVVVFSGEAAARRAVKQGELYATVFPHPAEVGRQAIDAVSGFLRGNKIPSTILIPCTVYRSADAAIDLSLLDDGKGPVAAR